MYRKQRGVTFIGWVVLLMPIAILGYAVIRLVPLYLNYERVARTVTRVAAEAKDDESTNATALRVAIDKQLDVEGVEFPTTKDFVIRRDGRSWVIEVAYEETAPFLSNVQLLVSFQKSARIGTAPE